MTVPAGVGLTVTATDNVQTETMVLTGGLVLNGAGAKLTLTGDSTSAIAVSLPTAGKGIEVNTDGGEIILNSSVTLSGAAASISMAAGAGDLTLDVALGKTLAGTVDVNDNTLTLADRGNPGIIQMDTAGGVLDVNATCAPTAVNVGAKVTIDLAGSARLNINVGIGTYTLTLTGGSVVLQGSASGGSGQYTYSWSPTAGLSDPSSATPTASPTETTTYTLTVTDTGDNNKTASDQATVTVTGLVQCGVGLCGAGAAPLLPLTMLTMVGWSWRNHRRRTHG